MIDAANDTQPLEDVAPNASGETAMEEEVVHGLRTLFTKRAQSTIWPSTFRQAVGRPHSILVCKPSKEFDFRRRPHLPNSLVKCRVGGAEELHSIGGLRGVLAICRELPRDIIGPLGVKVNGGEQGPKVHKLQEMVH
jgi:hypothetical protein